jgi:hypothetical protein
LHGAKWTKVPYSPDGQRASSVDPNAWSPFEHAQIAYATRGFDGVGLVLDGKDGLIGFDFDHCVGPDGRITVPKVEDFIRQLNSYTEISPSGRGIRVFAYAALPPDGRKEGPIECYDTGRYLTVTGRHYDGTPSTIEHRQAEVNAVHAAVFAARNGKHEQTKQGQQQERATNDVSDEELLWRARLDPRGGEKFKKLHDRGDTSDFKSPSEADFWEVMRLTYWAQKDAARIERLFRSSKLKRDKWDRDDYIKRTIDKAIANCRKIWSGPRADQEEGAHPEIIATDRQLRAITADALEALQDNEADRPHIFQRGDVLVWLRFDDAGKPAVEALAADALRGRLARSADWYSRDKHGDVTAISPPKDIAIDVINLPRWDFPRLHVLAESPFFDSAGRLICKPGYDPLSGTYLHCDLAIDAIPSTPSESQVASAYEFLRDELLPNFPFVDNASRAHGIALLLQPFARGLIEGPTPAYAVDAPTEGSGKGLLAELAAIINTGRPGEVIPETRSGEELRKQLTALLLRDAPITLFDNLKRRVADAALLSALTARIWKDRILGKSKVVSLPVRTTWIFTGNNLRFDSEAARRVSWIRIDPKLEQPWTRPREEFKHYPLPDWVHENRAQLVWSCLLLIQNWVGKGRPPYTERTLGTFESWAQVMGGILEAAGITEFLTNLKTFHQEADEETAGWRDFVSAWWEAHNSQPVQSKDLVILATDTLPEGVLGENEDQHAQIIRLGLALANRVHRVYGDWQIRRATGTGKRSQHRPGFALSCVKQTTSK